MFESLRPDHIIQGVARFYLATPFYLQAFFPLQNNWLSVEPSLLLIRSALLTKVEAARAKDLSRLQADWKEKEAADADAMVP